MRPEYVSKNSSQLAWSCGFFNRPKRLARVGINSSPSFALYALFEVFYCREMIASNLDLADGEIHRRNLQDKFPIIWLVQS
jgi:hypothetical protein